MGIEIKEYIGYDLEASLEELRKKKKGGKKEDEKDKKEKENIRNKRK